MLKLMMGGCLTLVLLLAGGGFMAWRWWETEGKAAATSAVQKGLNETIDESNLSDGDKKKLRARVDTLTAELKAGKIGMEDFGRMMEALAKSGLFEAAGVEAWVADAGKDAEGALKDPSVRAAAEKTLRRYVKAIMDGKLDEQTREEISAVFTTVDKEGNKVVKENVSAEDLQKALEKMKAAADKADIPQEAPKVDYVEEFTRIVDKVLAERKRPG